MPVDFKLLEGCTEACFCCNRQLPEKNISITSI